MLSQAEKVEQSRFNMVEQQVRTWEVLDAKVLDLLQTVPREDFVPKEYKGLAFADIEIPLGHGRFMLAPKIEGRFLQALALKSKNKVLEIGTGAGYLTALMAKQADVVMSYDTQASLQTRAKKNLAAQNIKNVKLFVGDGLQVNEGIYDAIVMTASLPSYPKRMERLLAIGGRMLVVVGSAPVMQAMLITRLTPDSYHHDVLFETCLPAMENAPQPSQFVF
jgi:protein-L-isoaspartate(D-aspartate) O-methyltransferase